MSNSCCLSLLIFYIHAAKSIFFWADWHGLIAVMSVFKLREFWTVFETEKQVYDQSSILVTHLNCERDYIITGSQTGLLRIFEPSNTFLDNKAHYSFNPNNLLFEKYFKYPILQLGCGKLVS